MARFNASRFRSQMNRATSQLRQTGREADRTVAKLKRDARAYESRQRTNHNCLNAALRQLQSQPTSTTRYVTYWSSVQAVQESFIRLESAAESGTWVDDEDLLDLAEGEAAASAETLTALLAQRTSETAELEARLNDTTIGGELLEYSADLNARWRGALFALSPANPDAARHFCTSVRELFVDMLDNCATDAEVLALAPDAQRTKQGSITRRARISHRIALRGEDSIELAEFVEADVNDVINLIKESNDGTHGPAGRFDPFELQVLKARAEDAIKFLCRVLR